MAGALQQWRKARQSQPGWRRMVCHFVLILGRAGRFRVMTRFYLDLRGSGAFTASPVHLLLP